MLVSEHCRWCVYFTAANDVGPFCAYILIEGHSRGCPAGDDCTVFKKARKKNRAGTGEYRLVHTKAAGEPELEKEFYKLYCEGESDAAIARTLDVCVDRVHKWRRSRGLPTQKLIGGR